MALAAEDFADLYESMGLAGTAAGNLADTLERVTAAERQAASIAKLAAESGKTVAQVRAALGAAAAAQAAAERAAAQEQQAAMKAAAAAQAAAERAAAQKTAAQERAAAAVERAAERAAAAEERAAAKAAAAAEKAIAVAEKAKAAQEKADAKIMADNLNRLKVQDEAAAKMKARDEERANTSKWFAEQQKNTASESLTGIQRVLDAYHSWKPVLQDVGRGIEWIATKLVRLSELAIAASQAKDRLRDFFGAITGTGATGGVALIGQLDRLARQLNTTSAQLEPYAKRLLAVRMPAQDLDGALKAITASSALMGEQGGAAAASLYEEFQKLANMRQRVILSSDMQTRLAQAGVSAKALAKELGVTEDRLRFVAINAKGLGDVMQRILLRQGAGALQAMGRSWDTISARFKEGINDAFSGLSDIVSPFMEEVQKLASEFYKGSAGSGILSGAVRGVLEPAFKTATAAVRVLHIALLYVQIYGLKAYIALRPLWDILGKLEVGAKASWVALYVLKGTLVVLAVIFGVLAVAVALVALPFVVLGIAIAGVVAAVQYLYGVLSGAVANIDNIKSAVLGALAGWAEGALTAAGDFVTGLVQGIAAGAGAVANAVKQLAMGALSAFTGAFGIKSPSTVMRKHGKVNIAEEGLGGGIDQGRGKVEKSMRALTAPPKKGSAGPASGKSSGLFGSIGQVVFNYYGKKDDFDDFAEKAEAWLEQLAMSGPEPEPEAT